MSLQQVFEQMRTNSMMMEMSMKQEESARKQDVDFLKKDLSQCESKV